jgi:hypothetical protein
MNIAAPLPARWPIAVVLPLLLAGCLSPLEAVKNIGDVSPSELVVVGRVEFVPRLTDEDQEVDFIGDEDSIKKKVFLGVDRKFVLFDKETLEKGNVNITDVETLVHAAFEETFYVKKDREALHIPYVMFYSKLTGRAQHRTFLPAQLRVDFQPGDRAIYIGTIRYHRNEYFDITKFEIADDFAKEEAAFRKKFGGKVRLVKRLAIPLDKNGKAAKRG